MKKHSVFGIIAAIILSLSACGPSKVVVTDRPSPPVVVRPAQPAPDYIWIDGEWYESSGKYIWRDGYWSHPKVGHVWVPGHWVATRGGYYWERGHWG